MSKLDQLKALGDATRKAKQLRNMAPIQETVVVPKPQIARMPKIPVAKEPEASGHNRSVMNPQGPDHRGSSRVSAGRTVQDSPQPSPAGAVAIRKPGRPKITSPRPWETEGVSRSTYYRDRRRAEEKR